jgi:hypothetical protein
MIYLAEKNGEPTRYNIFRQAIDRAIEGAVTNQQFGFALRLQGFEMKLSGKHWTIRMAGDNRVTRLYRLGDNYTGPAITKRILDSHLNKKRVFYPKPKPTLSTGKLMGSFRQAKRHTGWRALYYYYLYRMGTLPKDKPRPPSNPILWEDVRQLRKLTEQIRLLVHNKIDTSQQLQAFVKKTENRMDDLIRQRTHIQNKLRRTKDPEVIETLKAEKTALTEHIMPLRRNLRAAAEIEERTARMKEKLTMIRESELLEKQKQQQSKQKGGRVYAR